MQAQPPGQVSGLAVDAFGGAAVDPTKNVLDMVEAAVKRIDDMAGLRSQLVDEKIHRMDREWRHQATIAEIRSVHAKEIRLLESDRLDKIRSVDVANAAATAAQLLAAVQTLASTAAGTAETLRNQVTATAAAVANQTERIINPIIERVGLLEKSQYTITGRSAVTDPAMSDLVTEMRALRQAQTLGTGKAQGMSDSAKILLAVIGALATILTIGSVVVAVVVFLNR